MMFREPTGTGRRRPGPPRKDAAHDPQHGLSVVRLGSGPIAINQIGPIVMPAEWGSWADAAALSVSEATG